MIFNSCACVVCISGVEVGSGNEQCGGGRRCQHHSSRCPCYSDRAQWILGTTHW